MQSWWRPAPRFRIRSRTQVRCSTTSLGEGSNVGAMDEMTCPKCQSSMNTRSLGDVPVSQCSSCGGIFLERADMGSIIEAENDWHRNSGPHTEPLPKITAEMTAPPPSRPKARSYIETLFT